MVYELRTYWAAPGKVEALHDRFRNVTQRIFDKHHMEVVGYWSPSPATEESGDLVYMLAFPSQEALASAWGAMRADPEWQQAKAASEVNGTLVSRLTSTVLLPTDYSPLR